MSVDGDPRVGEDDLLAALAVRRLVAWEWSAAEPRLRLAGDPRLLGVTLDQAERDPAALLALVHPDERRRVREALASAPDTGEPVDIDLRLLAPDGSERRVRCSARALRDGRGCLERLVGVVEPLQDDVVEQTLRLLFAQLPATVRMTDRELRFTSLEPPRSKAGEIVGEVDVAHDLTESVRAARRLAASEERYRQLVENAGDIIATTDLEGRVRDVNGAAEALLGWTRAEVLELGLEVVAAEQVEFVRDLLRRTLAGELEATVYEVDYRTKSGGTIPVEVSSRVVLAAGVPFGVQIVARDLRPRRALEERLRASQKLEAVGRLAGGVAQEYNNLLTAVLGHAELLLRRVEGPERDEVEAIRRAGERAARLTQQLLAFARCQPLRPRLDDLNEIVTGLERLLRPALGPAVELAFDLAPGGTDVRVDRTLIEQAIVDLTLVSRATEEAGAVTIATRSLRLEAEAIAERGLELVPGEFVLLSVSDTARLLDDATRARIFEPFFSPGGAGTGLELASVFGIVRQSGGDIAVSSVPGAGATFDVYLPKLGPPLHPAPVPGPAATVLLVEDDDLVRRLIREILEDRGLRVVDAPGGEEALELAEREPFDLLLTDIVMPKMNGRELAARLRRRLPDLRVVYTSGYAQAAIGSGADPPLDFVPKPFTAAELTAKVLEALARPLR